MMMTFDNTYPMGEANIANEDIVINKIEIHTPALKYS